MYKVFRVEKYMTFKQEFLKKSTFIFSALDSQIFCKDDLRIVFKVQLLSKCALLQKRNAKYLKYMTAYSFLNTDM